MTTNRVWIGRILVMALLGLPFIWAEATHYVAHSLLPGQVKSESWRAATSVASVVCAVLALRIIWRSNVAVLGKVIVSLCIGSFFGVVALLFQVRSKCGDAPTYIGTPTQSMAVASCS